MRPSLRAAAAFAAAERLPPMRPSSASHSGPANTEDKESRDAEVEVQGLPMQAAATTKNLDSTEVADRGVPQTRDELYGRGDGCSVRKADSQCVLPDAILDHGGPGLQGIR